MRLPHRDYMTVGMRIHVVDRSDLQAAPRGVTLHTVHMQRVYGWEPGTRGLVPMVSRGHYYYNIN